ncbi:MAG: YedE-related selenium metabolism membrane protein [Campylobacter sp.]|nr:YedE-related selenium metabolism membrane protein [Campylobacter sp.]
MSKTSLYIIAGALLGGLAALLSYFGNPANMGICAACFLRDSAGALGLHQVATLQYLRPEIVGLVFGGLVASYAFKDRKIVGISSPVERLLLGIFAMIGALIFLGCPWRAFIRLGSGDLSAIAGVVGLGVGVVCGRFFKSRGFALKAEKEVSNFAALVPVIIVGVLFLGLITHFSLGEALPLYFSQKGPGSQHASIFISLLLSFIVGVAIFKSKFCSVGAISSALDKNFSMFYGVLAVIISATVVNLAISSYHLGFTAQPIAHNDFVFNFLGMTLCGLCFSLASGCPGKHLVQMGGGNLNSAIFVLGMLIGAAFSHNFALASSPKGVTPNALYALIIGFILIGAIGFFRKSKA